MKIFFLLTLLFVGLLGGKAQAEPTRTTMYFSGLTFISQDGSSCRIGGVSADSYDDFSALMPSGGVTGGVCKAVLPLPLPVGTLITKLVVNFKGHQAGQTDPNCKLNGHLVIQDFKRNQVSSDGGFYFMLNKYNASPHMQTDASNPLMIEEGKAAFLVTEIETTSDLSRINQATDEGSPFCGITGVGVTYQ